MGPLPARDLAEGRILARRLTERRSLRLPRRAECAFPLHCRPRGVGRNPPASLRGTMKSGPTGQMRPGNPPPGCGGVLPGSASLGLRSGTSRKSAVWAEGLADGAPWARPGHHQAASCGLRRCRKLRVRRNPLVSSTFLSLETDRRRAVGPFLSRPTIGERPPSASCLAPLSP